jgi:hypothetical protein
MPDIAGALAAIESRFDTMWTATPKAFENGQAPDVLDGNGLLVPWVHFEAFATRAGIKGAGKPGDHVVVEDGEIVATVFVPVESNRATALQYATAIGEIFRVKEFYQSAGTCVRSWTPRVGRGDVTTSENPNGNWWAVTVTIPFEFIHHA